MSQPAHEHNRDESIKKLASLIKDIRFAMFTTTEDDGSLRSRPMATQEVEFDGDIWFFTAEHSGKVEEVQDHPQVNVAYAKPEANLWVSVSGTAEFTKDRAKMEELWKPVLKAWFPKGLEDPELSLIRVRASGAEYWDAPSNKLVRLAGLARALVTGTEDNQGKNEKLDL